jgi:hypothetical protein
MLNEGLRLQVAWDARQSEEIRQTFQLSYLSQNDRFMVLELSKGSSLQKTIYIVPPEFSKSEVTSLIMDGCDWALFTARDLDIEGLQLNSPALVSPEVIADNLDIDWCRYTLRGV